MMARSRRSNQRPDTVMQDRINQVDETSCTARPDHTVGSKAAVRATLALRLLCPPKRKSEAPSVTSEKCHVWTAPGWQGESSRRRLGRCSHVFGLFVRFT